MCNPGDPGKGFQTPPVLPLSLFRARRRSAFSGFSKIVLPCHDSGMRRRVRRSHCGKSSGEDMSGSYLDVTC